MLRVRPCDLAAANEFVAVHHRHHEAVVGHKFSLQAVDGGGQTRGVAIVGRPVARRLDDGATLEVVRVATDGFKNACSFLYGACARAARELGYSRILTYTMAEEPGTTLKAAGWEPDGETPGRSWSCPSRPRPTQGGLFEGVAMDTTGPKRRWLKRLAS